MPQEIPLERSETLRFTPASLLHAQDGEKLADVPVFVLGTPTPRDKRSRRLFLRTVGAKSYTIEALRAEMLAGAKALWGVPDEEFAEHEAKITAYWHAWDDYQLQLADDPGLEWSYDQAIEQSIHDLDDFLSREWRPYGRMLAANADFGEMFNASIAAVGIKSWTGLEVERERDGGALTPECVEAVQEALQDIERAAGLIVGTAWIELLTACMARTKLNEDEAKNSASPSPSGNPPPNSTTGEEATAAIDDGKSPASANSKTTPSGE